MMANILIAVGFFAIGFIVGGVFTIRTSFKEAERLEKELQNAQSDPLIIRVYAEKK